MALLRGAKCTAFPLPKYPEGYKKLCEGQALLCLALTWAQAGCEPSLLSHLQNQSPWLLPLLQEGYQCWFSNKKAYMQGGEKHVSGSRRTDGCPAARLEALGDTRRLEWVGNTYFPRSGAAG